jgi:hypothetical protein
MAETAPAPTCADRVAQLFRALAFHRRLHMAEIGKIEYAFRVLGEEDIANGLKLEMSVLSGSADLADLRAGVRR